MGDRDLLLGLDMGTTHCKAALFNGEGRVVSQSVQRNYEGPDASGTGSWPEDWWQTAQATIVQLWDEASATSQRVAGIGVSGRGGGFAALDQKGRSLVASWPDGRQSSDWPHLSSQLSKRLRLPSSRSIGYITRLAWLREHEPDVYQRVSNVMGVKDYVLWQLTGQICTDPSSGPGDEEWQEDLFGLIDFPTSKMPPIRPHTSIAGALTSGAAAGLGLAPGLPVVVGGHDGMCAHVGVGAIAPTQAGITLGTTGVFRVVTPEPIHPAPNIRLFSYPLMDGLWLSGGNIPGAGRSVEWACKLFRFQEQGDVGEYQRMDEEAAQSTPGARGLVFLPFLAGSPQPFQLTDPSGVLAGLTHQHNRGDIARALMEGIAYTARSIAEAVAASGHEYDAITLTGGGATSLVWPQILADVFGKPMRVAEELDSCRGAAILLAVGVGWHGSVPEAVSSMVRGKATVEPQGRLLDEYERAYSRFRDARDKLFRSGDMP